MKKLFLSLLVAAVAITSCEKSTLGELASGETATVTISADAQAQTRSVAGNGDITKLHYYLEVYLDGEFYYEDDNDSNVFTVDLLTNQTFDVLVWADYAEGYYNTADLRAVTLAEDKDYTINTTDRDAFAGAVQMNVTKKADVTLEITRPFGRINVQSTDVIPQTFRADKVAITYENVYTSYSVLDGAPLGEQFSLLVDPSSVIDSATGELSADYLFAPSADRATVTFTQTYSRDDEDITSYKFTNIPYQANYQTNISGKILTDSGSITIDVTEEWTGTISKIMTVSEANDIIANAEAGEEVEIEIVGEVLGDITLIIPSSLEAAGVTVIFTDVAAGTSITVKGEDGDTAYTGNITIKNESGTEIGSFEVNAPDAHVELIEGSYTTVYSNTSATTLVVAEGTTVGTLIVEGGNVEIYGDVTTVTFDEKNTDGAVTVWGVSTGAQFATAVKSAKAEKIVLLNDIDQLAGYDVTNDLIIDGGGNNMYIKNYKLTCYADLTVQNVNITTYDGSAMFDAFYSIHASDITISVLSTTFKNYSKGNGGNAVGVIGVYYVGTDAYDGVSAVFKDSRFEMVRDYQALFTSDPATANKKQHTNWDIVVDNCQVVMCDAQTGEEITSAIDYSTTYGITLGYFDGVSVDINNSTFRGMTYPFESNNNDVVRPSNMELNITNSTLDGTVCFINGISSKVNIKGSSIIGRVYASVSAANGDDGALQLFRFDGNSVVNILNSTVRSQTYYYNHYPVSISSSAKDMVLNLENVAFENFSYYSDQWAENMVWISPYNSNSSTIIVNDNGGNTISGAEDAELCNK